MSVQPCWICSLWYRPLPPPPMGWCPRVGGWGWGRGANALRPCEGPRDGRHLARAAGSIRSFGSVLRQHQSESPTHAFSREKYILLVKMMDLFVRGVQNVLPRVWLESMPMCTWIRRDEQTGLRIADLWQRTVDHDCIASIFQNYMTPSYPVISSEVNHVPSISSPCSTIRRPAAVGFHLFIGALLPLCFLTKNEPREVQTSSRSGQALAPLAMESPMACEQWRNCPWSLPPKIEFGSPG